MVRQSRKAKLEHERLVSLVNSMADGVIAVDEHLGVVLFNGAALNILDQNTIKIGTRIDKLVNITDRNDDSLDLVEYIHSCKTQTTNRDFKLIYSKDDFINLYLSVAPVHLGYGVSGARGYVVLMRDITHEKSLEEERDEFISVVSHELRTPIAIAEGNLSNVIHLATKTELPSEVNTAIKQSYDQIILLANMINDLSTLSRAERGVLHLEVEQINPTELVENLVAEYEPQAAAKSLKIEYHTDPNLEMMYSGKLYVQEILQNFVTNAIKYTEEGQVTISVTPAKGGTLFEITDTGIGISKSDQKKVFTKFFRSEDYRTRKNNGTGLGLYVALKLMNLLGAKVELKSELDKGSTFSILIPNLKPAASELPS